MTYCLLCMHLPGLCILCKYLNVILVHKMYMTMPLTSNGWNSSSELLSICLPGYDPQFGLNTISSFLLNLMVN